MPTLKPTLRQLQVFESVADELSFTRASEKLHLSQPAVSIQVKQLEEGVGLPLFEHAGKRISLTEAGWIIYRCSQTIRSVLEDAGEQIDELMGIQRGKLDITVATTASYFASRILAGFAYRFPQIAISLDAVLPGRPESIPLAERDAGKTQLAQEVGVAEYIAFVQSLYERAEIVISEDALAAQDLFQ